MTLNYRKDLIQTHPYLGNYTKEEREICRAKKSFRKPVSKNELPDQKALLDKAVKKTVKALRSEYERKQKKAQGHIDLTEIRNRSVKVQKSNNTSKDTSDAIIRLKNDMKDRLGKLPILTRKQEKIDKLNDLCFIWNPLETDWEESFSRLEKFYEANGHSSVPSRHKTEDGFKLGNWVSYIRNKKDSLSKERIDSLNVLDFVWNPFEADWEEGYSHLKKFYEENGHSRIHQSHKTDDGFRSLGGLYSKQTKNK